MNPVEFGRFLSEERKAKNLTQRELAEKLGVTDKAISKWERGVCLPDVAKFDDIAAALDLTDIEVLRAHRLPPEAERTEENAPPFFTGRQAGKLLLWWLILTVALYIADLLNMTDLVTIYPLSIVLWYPLTAAFAIRLGLRDAEGVRKTDWRGVCIYALAVVVGILLVYFFWTAFNTEFYWYFMDAPAWLTGANRWEMQDYFYDGTVRWELRWQLYWFLCMRFFNQDALFTIAETFGVYAVAKLLRIRRNAKRQTNG